MLEATSFHQETPPPLLSDKAPDDWTPYRSQAHSIDHLLNIWAASLIQAGSKTTLFSDHQGIYKTIDNTPIGNVKWQSFSVKYTGTIPDEGATPWMADSHDVWFHDPRDVVWNMLANPDYAIEIDLKPYCEFATDNNERRWQDFMSGDWAWSQADMIANDTDPHGSTFVPIILRSDKTTVSSLKPGMTEFEVARFRDGHYCRIIYGLGPYIADYKEQVLLACIVRRWCLSHCENLDEINLCHSRLHTDALIEECDHMTLWNEYGIVGELMPFTNDFPHADTHELLAPDLLHQIIKGAYKDHLVEWVKKYLLRTHGKIVAVPSFPGLHRFPQGRHFKRWTGDDLKALMKVYLPAIEGYVPIDVVHIFCVFLKFCYLVRCNVITEKSLDEIQDTLTHFHKYREIFKTTEVVLTFSLPRQHSMSHYVSLIQQFGAPNASHVDFRTRGMLSGTFLSSILATLEPLVEDRQPHKPSIAQQNAAELEPPDVIQSTSILDADVNADYEDKAQSVPALADKFNIPNLADLVRQFLVKQLHPDKDPTEVPSSFMESPCYEGRIRVFNSINILCTWRGGHTCKDCVFVITDPHAPGMQGMDIARVLTFFSFRLRGGYYPCAVVRWFNRVGEGPDDDTGMWMVKLSSIGIHAHFMVIHVDTIFRSAHLIPVYGTEPLPLPIKFHHVLDIFTLFYVNRYADHHAFEIAS
ncbi:hypothetical protein DFH29DRAFT_983604 [Suillus ampliporus]|nr:hypothetical protein DFH29DRAFT_983604 [Suillus ampliporus]